MTDGLEASMMLTITEDAKVLTLKLFEIKNETPCDEVFALRLKKNFAQNLELSFLAPQSAAQRLNCLKSFFELIRLHSSRLKIDSP